jgi:hypothetical protein
LRCRERRLKIFTYPHDHLLSFEFDMNGLIHVTAAAVILAEPDSAERSAACRLKASTPGDHWRDSRRRPQQAKITIPGQLRTQPRGSAGVVQRICREPSQSPVPNARAAGIPTAR